MNYQAFAFAINGKLGHWNWGSFFTNNKRPINYIFSAHIDMNNDLAMLAITVIDKKPALVLIQAGIKDG
jgi:hypothetical protein